MSRINPGTMIVGLFAVLLSVAGAFVVRQYLQQQPVKEVVAEKPAEKITIVPVASRDLLPGKTLSFGDVAIMRLNPEQLKKVKLPAEFMTDSRQLFGRILEKGIAKGDAFSPSSLYAEGTGPTVADLLKPGYRAMTITVDAAGVVAGFASPGTIVDVLFRSDKTEDLPETTYTILQGVEVLAVDMASYPGSKPGTTVSQMDKVKVTLAVTPEQAANLKVLEDRGELSLVLRSEEDAQLAMDLGKRTLEDVLGIPPREEVKVEEPIVQAPPAPRTMDVYLGGNRQTYTFSGRTTYAPIASQEPPKPGSVPVVDNPPSDDN